MGPFPMKLFLLASFLFCTAGTPQVALSQDAGGAPRRDTPPGPLEVHEPPTAPGIAWFGTWVEALAEAKRTNRPILFMSAAPQCQSVPGVW